MIKKFFLILLILSIGKLGYAENWSNDKKYPTNINAAEGYIFDKHRQIEKKINKDFDYPLLQGIWYGQYLGWVGIYEEESLINKYMKKNIYIVIYGKNSRFKL